MEHDGHITSGQIGTPQICVDTSADRQLTAAMFAAGLKSLSKSASLVTVFSWLPIEALARAGFHESQTSGTAALDLTGGPKKVFSKLKGRSQIRHAISAGVEARLATPDDLVEHYAILKAWYDRKGMKCPSLEYFRKSFELTENRRLFVATYQGKIIAGAPVRFYRGGTAEYGWNASIPEFQHLRPNDLLHWRIIE